MLRPTVLPWTSASLKTSGNTAQLETGWKMNFHARRGLGPGLARGVGRQDSIVRGVLALQT